MIKILSIAFSAMMVLLVSFFVKPETKVTATSNVAPQLQAGEDCVVSITLTKGTVSGYARLQQILPQGQTATPVETMGAEFMMEDNIVKFIWLNLPSENSFTVSYKIQTLPYVSETQSVSGTFYYVENEKTQKVILDPVQLNFSSTPNGKPEVERKIFAVTPETGEYKVELTIHRNSEERTARFVDNIPTGYTVTAINTNGGKFMFSNQQAIFLWAELPPDSVFKISYNLNATAEQHENPQVTGMLVYGEEGEEHVNVASNPAAATAETMTASIQENPEEQIAQNLIAQEKEKSSPQTMTAYIPAPQKGIFFKIQIAATKKSPLRDDHYFQSKYHFDQHVDLADLDGWRKYMIGNFDSYASANAFNTRTREKVPDAFVVAYRNAERIAIKEAVEGNTKGD